jgi:uncharacterized membrane protein YesL
MGRMAAPRALWRALVSLYEETLTLLIGNLAWLALNLPLFIVLVFVSIPFAGFDESIGPQSLMILIAWLFLFMPSPGGVGLAALAAATAGPDVPRMAIFWQAVRARWKLSLVCMLVSGVVAVALLGNLYFYAVVGTDWMRYASFLWLYASLFWLGMHVYLLPLLVHVSEPRLLDLYRRAALITLGHPIHTLILLVGMLLIGSLTLLFLPIYVLIGGAYIAMVQAHGFREIRRRHGDLPVETDEGMKSL